MKVILCLCLFVLVMNSAQKASAQCNASDIMIQHIVPAATQTPGTCSATFDLSFTMQNNNGNKYIFLHTWLRSAYPDFFDCINGNAGGNGSSQPPESSDLSSSFINVGIDNSGTSPVIISNYPPDAGVTLNSVNSVTKTNLANGLSFFVLHGVQATFPVNCGAPVLITMDFWSSQSANAQVAHCVSCNRQFAINYINVAGFANCATLSYNVGITNRQSDPLTGYVRVFADANSDGYFSSFSDPMVTDATNFSLAGGAGASTTLSGSIPVSAMNRDLLVIVTLTGSVEGTTIAVIPSSQCGILPVTLKSFTAVRTGRSNALLKWETATEINNKGFALQKSIDHSTWETITFITTQANGGNSSSTIGYSFTDVNSERGMTLYRLKQIDFEGNTKLSEIRSVRGNGQKVKTIVYPNPSSDGKVNIVFENAEGLYDANLFDLNGRMIRQWKGLTGNTFQITNLDQGMYSLRIIDKSTGEQVVEKIVVSRQ